jgi:hypothetical protein
MKEIRTATQLLSVKPLVESHTPSATPELESALNVNLEKIKTASKLRRLAMKNAPNKLSQNAPQWENVKSAKMIRVLIQDASQPEDVRPHASHTHHQDHTCTNAIIKQLNQNALLMKMLK